MNLQGKSFIGGKRQPGIEPFFFAVSPLDGGRQEPQYGSASGELVDEACQKATAANESSRNIDSIRRADFLDLIADKLDGYRAEFVVRASLETGLPNARFEGELSRAMGQFRMFAGVLREGSWLDARIDRAEPKRSPLPKPDIRSMRRAIGPVAVFCASNFPIAFSVAGGDTASALAAGCPVVVMANPAHPGTAEIAGRAISEAVSESGLDSGWFSLLFSGNHAAGTRLVENSAIKAVGFTGSRKGGLAIAETARKRSTPIKVFAEMSSVNPVFLFPGAVKNDPIALAKGIFDSFTLGCGQFCTKPGVVFAEKGESTNSLINAIQELAKASSGYPLLSNGIHESYHRLAGEKKNRLIEAGASENSGHQVPSLVYRVSADEFATEELFAEEHFGPSLVLVEVESSDAFEGLARGFEGQLTATIHYVASEEESLTGLVGTLEEVSGRVIMNGFPTGVEVCDSIVHGGPFPATTDASTTSVGARALERFTKLICFQDFTDSLLPNELKDQNPLGIPRREH